MIDWDNISTVLLDMDGTLLDLHFDNYFWMQHLPRIYAAKHKISEAASIEHLRSEFAADQGTLPWYCIDHWSDKLSLDIPALKREMQHMISLRPHVIEFLRQLRDSGKDVVMVTNAHRKTLDIKMNQVNISSWFDRIVVSHDLNSAKEEQEFWQKLQKLHPFNPATTLLIDDTQSVLQSAKQYGIAHLLTLLQPDSQQPKRITTTFPGIHHFDEIMPLSAP